MTELLSQLNFGSPVALWALLSLPVIWWLLRFVPPRPQTIQFPPVRILLGLDPKTETPDKMPWWLMLLRLALAALVVAGVALPFLSNGVPQHFSGHTLVIVDDGWAAAKDWKARQGYLVSLLGQARRDSGVVTLVTSTGGPSKMIKQAAAGDVLDRASALVPSGLSSDRARVLKELDDVPAADHVVWLSDGLAADQFALRVQKKFSTADFTAVAPGAEALPLALGRLKQKQGDILADVLTAPHGEPRAVTVQARASNGRVLLEQSTDIKAGASSATVTLSLPTELRNDVQSVVIADAGHAAARQLLDDSWRRKTVAMQANTASESAQPLLSPLYYVSRALQPYAEVIEPKSLADLQAVMDAGLSMLVLADVGVIPQQDSEAIKAWVEKGGVLLRFAGPRLAASPSGDLLPVSLREGGRELGSALSWEEPQTMQDFSDKGPFVGMKPDSRATINQQVLAVPDAELVNRTWASLNDGTPLVTANQTGKGMIVLFHVTAGPDWSNLPLTGTFVDMLKRIVDLAPAAGSLDAAKQVSNLNANTFTARLTLNGKGELVTPGSEVRSIAAAAFDKTLPALETPAGLYGRGQLERAVNLDLKPDALKPLGALPPGIAAVDYAPPEQTSLVKYALLAALALFLADCLVRVLMEARHYSTAMATGLALLLLLALPRHDVHAETPDDAAMKAALETHLAYVKTGKSEIDDVSEAGLKGLDFVVNDRTSVSLADPAGVDIETDDIVFYPLLYWPIDPDAQAPSDAAVRKLEAYMKSGGTIFFDLREDGLGSDALRNEGSANGDALRRVLSKLDVPPLDTVADKHVLKRSFYLLESFPGRYTGGPLWVEAGDASKGSDPGSADGVSSIIIGSNDYAAAWAMDEAGNPQFAVVPGEDRQREFAFRTGVNVVMYALTGNYKADQVHIPALLERLGQ